MLKRSIGPFSPRIIRVGSFHECTRVFSQEDVCTFAKLVGDHNPIHVDREAAIKAGFKDCIVHGMLVGSLFSEMMGMHVPGPQSIYLSQSLRFSAPVFVNEELKARIEVKEFTAKKGLIRFNTRVWKYVDGKEVVCVSGEAVGMNKVVTFEGESSWTPSSKL